MTDTALIDLPTPRDAASLNQLLARRAPRGRGLAHLTDQLTGAELHHRLQRAMIARRTGLRP